MDRTERVLAAAAELFVRFGVAKTTVDEIARAAGISKGAIYLEFQSKDALVEALVRHELRAYLRAAAARVQADDQGGRLSRIYHHCTAELLDRPFLRALYTRDVEVLGARLRRNPPSPSGPRPALSEAFVERLRSAGLVRAEVDPAVLGHLMGVISLGLIMIGPLRAGAETRPELLGRTLDLIADMFAATVDTPPGEGDVAAGKQAFLDLLGQVGDSLDGEKVTA